MANRESEPDVEVALGKWRDPVPRALGFQPGEGAGRILKAPRIDQAQRVEQERAACPDKEVAAVRRCEIPDRQCCQRLERHGLVMAARCRDGSSSSETESRCRKKNATQGRR